MSMPHEPEKSSHYTFGDTALASARLGALAELFLPSLTHFVRRHALAPVEHLIDLGCGPGHSTRQLAGLISPAKVTGLEVSQVYLEQARRGSPPTLRFAQKDVREPRQVSDEFAPADLLFSRFLLTHLSEPGQAIRAWASYGRPGACYLLQETARMRSSHPVLQRYYELVGALQRSQGQKLELGGRLTDFVELELFHVESFEVRSFALPGNRMAQLHRMNLETWRRDPAAIGMDGAELDRIALGLRALEAGPPDAAVVDYAMGELVLRLR